MDRHLLGYLILAVTVLTVAGILAYKRYHSWGPSYARRRRQERHRERAEQKRP